MVYSTMEQNKAIVDPNIQKFYDDFQTFSASWYPYIVAFVITLITGIRKYMGGPKCTSFRNLNGKVVVITGASSGIGLETAKELAAKGGKIVMACRSGDKGKLAMCQILKDNPQAKLDLRIVDMSCMESVRTFSKELGKDYESIDVLINNAAVTFQEEQKTREGFELTYATNYFGPVLLSHLLLPLLVRSHNGRILNITALAHFSVDISLDDIIGKAMYNPKKVFGQTKLALMLFTKHLARICKNLKVTVNAVNPGLVRGTNHFKTSAFGSSFMARISTFPWIWLFLKTPNQGCQTIVYGAIDPYLDVTTGAYFSDCEHKDSAPTSKDYKLAEKIYKKTCEMLNIDSQKLILELTEPI